MNTHRFRTSTTVALGVLALTLGIGRAQAATTMFGLESQTGGQSMPGHLYAGTTSSKTNMVYSFPLKNGIPAQKPDRVLTVDLGYVQPVAVDSRGYLYVGDLASGLIDVFAPGANGNAKPIRQIVTDQSGVADIFFLDSYMITNAGGDVEVYAKPRDTGPSEPTCSVCISEPIEAIPTKGVIYGMTLDPFGTIYAMVLDEGLEVFPKASNAVADLPYPLIPSRLYTSCSGIASGIAVDRDDLYCDAVGRGTQTLGIDVIPIHGRGKYRHMSTEPCYWGAAGTIVINGALLYMACGLPDGVYVYNKYGQGKVKPLASLAFQGVTGIALGP